MLNRSNFVGPWAGLPVAWNDDDTFDEETYRLDVRACCEAGATGVYTHGSTGEFYAMEFDEWQAVATACVEECKTVGTPAMVGCTSTYTLGVTRRIEVAKQLGAEAVQVALPFWYELHDSLVVPFFQEVAAAAEGLALSIYETARTKKTLTVDQHRAIRDVATNYVMVKSNPGTIGYTEDGCAALSEFVNVFTIESQWATLGPKGAIGSPSSFFYANPRFIVKMWELLAAKDWPALKSMCDKLDRLLEEAVYKLLPDTYHDTSHDRLDGLLAGFLKTSMRNRGPYPSTNKEDIERIREWCRRDFPEFLEL